MKKESMMVDQMIDEKRRKASNTLPKRSSLSQSRRPGRDSKRENSAGSDAGSSGICVAVAATDVAAGGTLKLGVLVVMLAGVAQMPMNCWIIAAMIGGVLAGAER